jgi:hypothetical protein
MNQRPYQFLKSKAQSAKSRTALKESNLALASLALAAFALASTAEAAPETATRKTPATMPWSQLRAKAAADYRGDGLAVVSTAEGVRLHCAFQRLEGEVTCEGLWLTSTVTNTVNDRFRVVATQVGRVTPCTPEEAIRQGQNLEIRDGAHGVTGLTTLLPNQGKVSSEGQTVRFIRPGLIEEYSASMDGVRQDFVALERPSGAGDLSLRLAVSGARVKSAALGVQLALENSGRKIAYSRPRVTDATGKELPARIQVPSAGDEEQPAALPLPKGQRWGKGEERVGSSGMQVLVNDTDAIYPVRIDPTFSDANWISMGGIPGADGYVSAAVVDSSGNLYVGGGFTMVGDVFATNVAKWDGRSWSALGSGIGDAPGFQWVSALALLGGDLYAGGSFTTAGGSPATNVAKWNGSNWSAVGSGVGDGSGNQSTWALAVSGGDLYAAGSFTTAGGSAANYVAKWNGTEWSALGSGVNNIIDTLVASGADLYAGGYFTSAGGGRANYVARWNGSGWMSLGSGTDGRVVALTTSGSDLYAGGAFLNADGSPANYIAKWDGVAWSALGSGMNDQVNALAVLGSGVYAGGNFTTAGGNAAAKIATWDGSSWSALGSGMDYSVLALAVSGGELYAGGSFTTAGGTAANSAAKWNGSSWSSLGSGMGSRVRALAVSGSEVYAGGDFTMAGGSPANYIAKWDGSSWSAMGSGMNSNVYALTVLGSDVYAGGAFTAAGGAAANYIARWDGSSWSALGSGIGGVLSPEGYAPVSALAVSGTNLYAGGSFTTAGDAAATNIARWDGSNWSPLGSGLTGGYGTVFALAVSGNLLYSGGMFTIAGGTAANYIANWDGSSWSALGSGVDDYVFALAVSGRDVYVGGVFTTAGGTAANYIAKWDGSNWSALGSGISAPSDYPYYGGRVSALAVSGNDLYAGGYFTTAGGSVAISIASWSAGTWSALGSGISGGSVRALALLGSDLFAGGDFTIAGGKVSGYVARAIVNPPILAIEPDGSGGYFIRFSGVPGSAYRLQRAATVTGSRTTTAPQTAPASGQLEFRDLFPPPDQAFYRSVQP